MSERDPHHDQRSTEWDEEQEVFARHTAHKLHQVVLRTKGHHKDVHGTNFSRSYGLGDSKERAWMVDSGASLHMMGLSSLNHKRKKTIRQ